MANPLGLYHDGDLRRIYEVPEDSSFIVDGDGYRIYTPDDIPSADTEVIISTTSFWSRFVDFRALEEWSTVAYDRTGGAFRFQNEFGVDVFQTFDLRLKNGWEVVPADYPHRFTVFGNLFASTDTGRDFDIERITANGVSPRVFFSDSLQTAGIDSFLITRIMKLLEADEVLMPNLARLLDRETKEVLLEKNITGGGITETIEIEDA